MNEPTTQKAILHCLIYSEVFGHPLTSEELNERVATPNNARLNGELKSLVEAGVVQQQDDYYFLFSDAEKIAKRKLGNSAAERLMPKAHRVGKKIFRFPYVEGVGISGSLSKGVLHDDGDFDFFIITRPNRLWVARTLLILYKKIFLLNSRKYFCVNYFIDTQNLEIEEKNPFTATEISTLIPVAGSTMGSFFEENSWIESFIKKNGQKVLFESVKKPFGSRAIMSGLNGKLGNWIDQKCMRMTLKRWQRKFGEFDANTFELTMKSRKYVSKHHPNNFQKKVLDRYADLKRDFLNEHQSALEKMGVEL